MTSSLGGGGGVWIAPKSDDVIYEQPLIAITLIILIIFRPQQEPISSAVFQTLARSDKWSQCRVLFKNIFLA